MPNVLMLGRGTPLKRSQLAKYYNSKGLSRSPRSVNRPVHPLAIAQPSPLGGDRPSDWMSGRNIDLCLLAVCSCVLSLMCHQGVGVVSTTSASSTGMNTASTSPAQVDFLVKAGLLTSGRQKLAVQESDDEAS